MLTAANWRDPVLINTIGHSAGLLLFGVILVLLVRDRRTWVIRQTKLSIMASGLALSWNIGALIALGSNRMESLLIGVVMTASFSALSLIPAVLLHVALRGRLLGLVKAGYAISGAAVILHVCELFRSTATFHQWALILIAVGFAVLTGLAILLQYRREPGGLDTHSEWISLAALLLFTSSFLHFGYRHVNLPWSAEITWHHLGIPVALIVLLQDYRFLLLDTFTRFLINFGWTAAYVIALLLINDRFRVWQLIHTNMFLTGIVLVILCCSLIVFRLSSQQAGTRDYGSHLSPGGPE